jgi:transposase
MVRRGELTNEAWERIAPLLPENGRRGKQWKDHRKIVNGILWKIRTGAPWRDLPESYGPWQTCYGRFTRWSRDGTWDRLLTPRRRSPTRWARWNGRLASTAPSPARTNTPPGHAVP